MGERLFSYRICGISLQSEIAIPGFPEQSGAQPCDAVLVRGAVPLALEQPQAKGPTWEMSGGDFLLRIPGIARFLIKDGREIVVDAAEDFTAFISGVIGILLQQRGGIVLNASAIRVNGEAVLFAGFSGAGKSVLAAALDARGYAFCADDICALDSGFTVHPDAQHPQLWDFAIGKLGLSNRRGQAVRAALQKYRVAANDICAEPLPLGAIYILREARAPHTPGIAPVEAADAPLLLRRAARHPRLLEFLGGREDYDAAATRLVSGAKFFHLTRRLDFALSGEIAGWLEDHWRSAP